MLTLFQMKGSRHSNLRAARYRAYGGGSRLERLERAMEELLEQQEEAELLQREEERAALLALLDSERQRRNEEAARQAEVNRRKEEAAVLEAQEEAEAAAHAFDMMKAEAVRRHREREVLEKKRSWCTIS